MQKLTALCRYTISTIYTITYNIIIQYNLQSTISTKIYNNHQGLKMDTVR